MKWDIWGIIVATGSAITGLAIIVFKTDPYEASFLMLFLFYSTIALSIWGVMTLAGYYIRRLIFKNFIHSRIISRSFAEGLIVSVAFVVFIVSLKLFF